MMHGYYMQQALAAARSSLYITSPNPRVGCVVVIDNQIIATGATQAAGGAHAEIMALNQAKAAGFNLLSQATVYVTLEPCSHYGRTPPCVDALIAAKPQTVVIAMLDPNLQVAGQGVAKLRAAGIEVLMGTDAELEAALALNIGFVARMVRGVPWLWLKTAASLDGRTALNNGESKWITGPAARADGQRFRARSCVVLTGINTVLADDPQLNVRHISTPRQPIRAVLDSQLRISPQAKIFDGDPVWIFTTIQSVAPALKQQLAVKNAQIISLLADAQGQIDLHHLMHWLAAQQINEVHVEAGATLNGAFLQAGYVDAILSYVAPVLVGVGRPMMQFPALAHLDSAPRFEFVQSKMIETDVRLLMRNPSHWYQLSRQLQQLQKDQEN